MGAEVTAFSHSESKKADALKMGATDFVATKDEKFGEKYLRTLDFLIITANVMAGPDFEKYIKYVLCCSSETILIFYRQYGQGFGHGCSGWTP